MDRLMKWALVLLAIAALAVACESPKEASPAEEAPEAQDEAETVEQEASQTDIPADQTMSGPTEGGDFYVVITPEPNPIPFQELFELRIEVYDSEARDALVEEIELDQLRATMPSHGHGMKNEPAVSKVDDGVFAAKGMRFHMQGEGEDGLWVVEPLLNHDGDIHQAKFDVQCCRE
jgi:hypothetical protein